MTATPIPRTLLLTSYGDMDVSRLDEKPPGRKPIATRIVPLERLDEVIAGIERAVASGAQIYWVCPLVAESEVLDIAAAEERHAELRARFGERVGLVHGKLAGKDKDRVMAAFASGALSILVSTTVIEVGVDVPNASIMIIEHAERFGLGAAASVARPGRTRRQGVVVHLALPPASVGDGARAVERDAQHRGRVRHRRGGFATARRRRSARHAAERAAAVPHRQPARARGPARRPRATRRGCILARDPELKGENAETLKLLLYLFERDDAIKLMRAG